MKIGVFDSGQGGKSVANAITKAEPAFTVLFRSDSKNLPYGSKTPEQLAELVTPILQSMVEDGCQVIVIACNTVTTTIIDELRKIIPVPLVGIEPMVKPAVKLTKSNVIAVCATPTTLQSNRYKTLLEEHAQDVTVLQPDCSDWAYMIESNTVDRQKVSSLVNEACEQGADVIVLACTHYHWIEDQIKEIAGNRAIVIQPELAIIKQLKVVVSQIVA